MPTTCHCGKRTITVKKAAVKKVHVKPHKVAAKTPSKQAVSATAAKAKSAASRAATKKATAAAKKKATGCNCSTSGK